MEQHCPCAQRLWIIEYAWAHNFLDAFKDVEASFWSEGEWEPLSLDESWRVRVASAQVFVIVKNRQISHYERVLAFLDNTNRLLPTVVPAIKHMKITFGLKTMVIMWMMKEGAGPVNVVQKINKYFPRKLPQYQEHCRKHEMYLMKKNQLDFRTFAQSLIMDKQKLDDYIKKHVEEQYGDLYAQKTEERLLHYLQELDKALPKGTYIDKIMGKNSPVKEEEKALLDLVTDDSTIATSLKALLRYDATVCYSLHKSELGTRTTNSTAPEGHVCIGVSTNQTAPETSTEAVRHVESAVTNITVSDAHSVRQKPAAITHTDQNNRAACGTDTTAPEASCPKNGAHVVKIPPHFCSKHQRWVRNILCECPGGSPDEQPPQDTEVSPLLFTSSSSSSDLTPSNLTVPPGPHQSPASDQLQKDDDPGSVHKPNSALEHPAQPAVQTFIPGGAVQVLIIPCNTVTTVSVCPLKTSPASNNQCSNLDQATTSTLSITAKTMQQKPSSPAPFVSKLSRKFRLGQNYSQKTNTKEHEAEILDPSPHTVLDAANLSVNATTSTDNLGARASPTDRVEVSPGSGAFSSSRMQPRVALKRMSTEECITATKRRACFRRRDDTDRQSESAESSFDVNSLYSSSSSTEGEDSDEEYRPSRRTLRMWFLGY